MHVREAISFNREVAHKSKQVIVITPLWGIHCICNNQAFENAMISFSE